MSLPPRDRLVAACITGDLTAAAAAVMDGASVNNTGVLPGSEHAVLPAYAALCHRQLAALVWLLAHGADVNGDELMHDGLFWGTPDMVQLLVDAGGDVNRLHDGVRPLFVLLEYDERDESCAVVRKVGVLMAQPALDLTLTCFGTTAERHARAWRNVVTADSIAAEVRRERVHGPTIVTSSVGDDGWSMACCVMAA